MSKPKKDLLREIAQELDTFDIMLSTLIELLEEKGIITQSEFEKKMKIRIERASTSKSYREIQFGRE